VGQVIFRHGKFALGCRLCSGWVPRLRYVC
jgi:hypothetical protein